MAEEEQPFGPELIFAVVAPVGTPVQEFHDKLAGDLLAYGYRTERIKLSDVLTENAAARGEPIASSPEDARIRGLIAEGDRYCKELEQASAVVLEGVLEIRSRRAQTHTEAGRTEDVQQLQNMTLHRTAYVLDSIKRPAEIVHLRQLYSDHVIVVGLRADTARRVENLRMRLTPQMSGVQADEKREIAKGLIEQDLTESTEYGQNTLKAFPMADVFIDVDGKDATVAEQVTRLTDLLFGSPNFPPPTVAEYGMHLAHIASTRSPELGLKVGAAVVREADGAVMALGANVHPTRYDKAPDYDASAVDIRDLVIDTLRKLGKDVLRQEAKDEMEANPHEYARQLLLGPLKGSAVAALIEFQPTVHAEMDALMCAIRAGHKIDGCTVYVTDFPCHNCAKHLIALGVPVRYIEPYPKSRAEAMYGDEVRGSFEPFTGVAPRRYQALFDISEDRKAPDGSRKPWGSAEKQQARPKVDPFVDDSGIAGREWVAVAVLPEEGSAEESTGPAETFDGSAVPPSAPVPPSA